MWLVSLVPLLLQVSCWDSCRKKVKKYKGIKVKSLPRGRLLCFKIHVSSFKLQEVVLLDILEVLVSGNLQLVGSRLVSNDNAVLVHLQG